MCWRSGDKQIPAACWPVNLTQPKTRYQGETLSQATRGMAPEEQHLRLTSFPHILVHLRAHTHPYIHTTTSSAGITGTHSRVSLFTQVLGILIQVLRSSCLESSCCSHCAISSSLKDLSLDSYSQENILWNTFCVFCQLCCRCLIFRSICRRPL